MVFLGVFVLIVQGLRLSLTPIGHVLSLSLIFIVLAGI